MEARDGRFRTEQGSMEPSSRGIFGARPAFVTALTPTRTGPGAAPLDPLQSCLEPRPLKTVRQTRAYSMTQWSCRSAGIGAEVGARGLRQLKTADSHIAWFPAHPGHACMHAQQHEATGFHAFTRVAGPHGSRPRHLKLLC